MIAEIVIGKRRRKITVIVIEAPARVAAIREKKEKWIKEVTRFVE